jgi:membrane protease YdiL (CAAX protease family)
MTDIVNKKPFVRQGWLRVLLFFIAYFVLSFFIAIPVILIIALFKSGSITDITNAMNTDFLWLTLLLSALISFIVVFIFRKWVDRRSLASLGFEVDGYFADAASGFFLAPVILGIGSIILFFSGHLQWIDVSFNGNKLFIAFGMLVIVVFSEELIFRGYILNNLMQSFNKWVALFISAILFALVHSLSPDVNLLSVAGLFLAGILLGINYVYTKNLWFAISFHLFWNFVQGPLLGYKVSGLNLPTLLQTEVKGDAMITGGDLGFEASMINILLLIVAVSTLYFIYEKKYKAVTVKAKA